MVLAEAPFNRVLPSTESPQRQANSDQLAHATEFRANVRGAYAHTRRLREARQAEGLSTDGFFTTIVVTQKDVEALNAVGHEEPLQTQMYEHAGGIDNPHSSMVTGVEPRQPIAAETVFTGPTAA